MGGPCFTSRYEGASKVAERVPDWDKGKDFVAKIIASQFLFEVED
jgi:hypothetical protein